MFECYYEDREDEIFARYQDEEDAKKWCGINDHARYRKVI